MISSRSAWSLASFDTVNDIAFYMLLYYNIFYP